MPSSGDSGGFPGWMHRYELTVRFRYFGIDVIDLTIDFKLGYWGAAMSDLEFNDRIRRIANLLRHKKDTSSFDPFEVEAAKIYLKGEESAAGEEEEAE